ncbi:MAG: Hpt domain-containing response regulator [Methylomonas sp.]
MTAQNLSVLIADDNELNRWLLCEQLQHWTTDITSAKEGQEAWELLQTRSYSLLFLDLNMPFLNGLEVIEKLRTSENINRSTPAIAVTAHAYDHQRQTIIAAGFNDVLVKPILLQSLSQVIESWQCLSTIGPAYYADQIIQKTEFNHELSTQMLNKLFEEVPENLSEIDHALRALDYQQAWQIAHKLHGSFCFYGFADFLPMADSLEQCLLNKDAMANIHLQAIKGRFNSLLSDKSAILACLIADGRAGL